MSIIEKLGFTPGPWEKDFGRTIGHIKSIAPHEKGYTPTVCKYDEFTQLPRSLSVDEIEANGHLIAVAPEMLEDEIENIKLLKHLLSFPVLKNCVGSKTIDWIEGRLFSTETTIQKADPQHRIYEEIKELNK